MSVLGIGWFALAGQANNPAATVSGLIWLSILVAGLLLAVALASYLRRRIRGAQEKPRAAFTVEELRRLRDRGTLTIAEFEALKRKVLDRSQVSGEAGQTVTR